jgi:phosphorylase kinase alpha/beta subunit
MQLSIKCLNRSLGQLTGEDSAFGGFKCPEAYYLENGRYVPNDNTPLLWPQANLWGALKMLEDNLKLLKK